jgi:hypothetical protein
MPSGVARTIEKLEQRLIDLILEVIPDAERDHKWGRLTFTRGGDWHHWICAVTSTKKAVKLTLHKGSLLADPSGAMEGDGRYTRHISFAADEELDPNVIAPILREAAKRQTEM